MASKARGYYFAYAKKKESMRDLSFVRDNVEVLVH